MRTDTRMWWKCGDSLRYQTPPWDWSVVCACVGKVGTGLSQASARSLRALVLSSVLKVEENVNCRSEKRKLITTISLHAPLFPPGVEGTGKHFCSEFLSVVG